MMRNLHDVGAQVVAVGHQPVLGGMLDVAGQQNTNLPILQQHDERAVVFRLGVPRRAGLLGSARRRQHGEPQVAPAPFTPAARGRVMPHVPTLAGGEDVAQVVVPHRGAVGEQVLGWEQPQHAHQAARVVRWFGCGWVRATRSKRRTWRSQSTGAMTRAPTSKRPS